MRALLSREGECESTDVQEEMLLHGIVLPER